MERIWTFERLAVTAARIDFADPALGDGPGVRERGVRLELRLTTTEHVGSVYASPGRALDPAVCRIDLLESARGAADRMHWHPVMPDGEPGDRVLDPAIGADPGSWLTALLADAGPVLERAGVVVDDTVGSDVAALARRTDEVVAAALADLEATREPWPEVTHDRRGLAPA